MRSRSCSSSRSCTPQGTPNRRSQSRSMTPGRGMPAKEQVARVRAVQIAWQVAVEQYLSRMSLETKPTSKTTSSFESSFHLFCYILEGSWSFS